MSFFKSLLSSNEKNASASGASTAATAATSAGAVCEGVREATKAGAWYTSDAGELRRSLKRWLDAARDGGAVPPTRQARAVIAPHAGYTFCGATAAHAFVQLASCERPPTRIYVLGPSHHKHTVVAEITTFATLATPIGNLRVDVDEVARLRAAEPSLVVPMPRRDDEEEHSIEMHLPFLAYVMPEARIVPLVVGALDERRERRLGRLLAPLLRDPRNFFCVSSDFCHWGRRFGFTTLPEPRLALRLASARGDTETGADLRDQAEADAVLPRARGSGARSHARTRERGSDRDAGDDASERNGNRSDGHVDDDGNVDDDDEAEEQVWQGIERLDRLGMAAIASMDPDRYARYQERYKNTICGRHSIAVLLHAFAASAAEQPAPPPVEMRFLHYSQSSKCVSARDSSVSYAAGVFERSPA